MAAPVGVCFVEEIEIDSRKVDGKTLLFWDSLSGADKYQIWRINESRWQLVGKTVAPRWLIHSHDNDGKGPYRIFAITEGGCQSRPGFYPLQ